MDATYADLRARFEQAVPTASADLTALLASGTPDYDALVAATNASAPQGFIRYYSLDASRLTVWGYDPADTHSVQYLFGNPLVTEKLYKQTGFLLYLILCTAAFILLMFTSIPSMYDLFNVAPSGMSPLWTLGAPR